jgi:glycosyltransferase involved in cell wall biosynthesis
MNICLVGKYPPIEGGVSAQTYWIARGLARLGHHVHVVTNAEEVEDEFRISLGPEDWSWYAPEFGDGCVTVYNPEPFSRRAMMHIPQANPFVSKLASLARDVIHKHDCDIILAYYYEPYGVAAWMASQWTGCPLVMKHAGSDLDRLFGVPDLATTYKEVLRRADAVVTQPRLMLRFLGMGVAPERLEADVPYSLDRDVFRSGASPLDVESLALRAVANPDGRFDPSIPTIGILGKIGVTKGTFDLIASLGRLAAEGIPFKFAALTGEPQGRQLLAFLERAGIVDRSWILPLIPNWRVPAFVGTCAAVCFLERDFPIAIHGPMVPREVLACGGCLVLSGEIADKQRYRDRLISGENVLIVGDPKDHDELCAVLRKVLTEPGLVCGIRSRAAALSRELEDHGGFAEAWENILVRYARGAPVRSADPFGLEPSAAAVEAAVPGLARYLRRRWPRLLDAFLAGAAGGNVVATAMALCDFALEHIDPAEFRELPQLREALRYARARLRAVCEAPGEAASLFPVSDRLSGRSVSRETAGELFPVRGSGTWIEEFAYDVSTVFLPSPFANPNAEDDPAVAAPGALKVLFQRSPNLIMRELRIDDSVAGLLDRCDGRLTTAQLLDVVCEDAGLRSAAERQQCADRVCAALESLYRSRVIVFGEKRANWGWTGGPR